MSDDKVEATFHGGGYAPTDEDVQRAVTELRGRINPVEYPRTAARDVLASIGPIVERERRAAKVEVLREAADRFLADDPGRLNVALDLRFWSNEIARGADR